MVKQFSSLVFYPRGDLVSTKKLFGEILEKDLFLGWWGCGEKTPLMIEICLEKKSEVNFSLQEQVLLL